MKRSSRWLGLAVVMVASLATTQAALGHAGHPVGSDALTAGALHPVLGFDHLLAALASGLLAVRIGTRWAMWMIPTTFVVLMSAGGALAATGLHMLMAEWGIAFSVIALGLMIAVLPVVPLSIGAALVGLFAACHGYAHVAEFSGGSLAVYMTGLALATLALHIAAIAAGLLMMRARRP
ncbi:MAG: HupE/UreJ family protein, partial [Tepidisphaeraceae bacterium]